MVPTEEHGDQAPGDPLLRGVLPQSQEGWPGRVRDHVPLGMSVRPGLQGAGGLPGRVARLPAEPASTVRVPRTLKV